MSNLTILNKDAQKVHEWLNSIQDNLSWGKGDDRKTLACFRAVLQEIRDNLQVSDLGHFIAPLPTFIKGLVFEQWKPHLAPLKERSKEKFLDGVKQSLPESLQQEDVESEVQAVLKTMHSKMPEEMEKIIKVLPRSIRELMPWL